MTDALPLPKITRFRKIVLLTRLFSVLSICLVQFGVFAVACRLCGTSAKEVQRQMRLQQLLGDNRRI